MSSTTGSQNLLTNIFRPAYRYEVPTGGSTAMFMPKMDICNIDILTVNSLTAFSAAIGDENENVYIGSNAGNDYSNLRGCSNVTAVGYGAAFNISNVKNSVYLGLNAGANALDSSANIAIGPNTKGNGISNIYIGSNTGSLGTGSNNIFIGHNLTGSNVSNTLLIGPTPTIYGNLLTRRVGIGRDPSYNMDISGDSRITYRLGIGMEPGTATDFCNNPLTNVPHTLDVSGYTFVRGGLGINADPADYTFNLVGNMQMDDGFGTVRIRNENGNTVFSMESHTPGKKAIFSVKGDICSDSIVSPGTSITGNITACNVISSNDVSGQTAHITNMYATTMFAQTRMDTTDISGTNASFSNMNVGTLVATNFGPANFAPSNIIVSGYVRDALVPVNMDISGGNISNLGTTRSSNFIGTVSAASNSIGGVTLSNTNLVLAGTITGSTANTNNNIGGVRLSNNTISNSGTTTSSNFIGTAAASNSIGGITLSNTNLTLAGTITGSTANTSNVIGGIVLSNNTISNSSTTTSSNFIGTASASNSIGGITLSNTNLTLAGTITGSTANTSNVIGGVVLSNNNISNSSTTTSSNFIGTATASNSIGGVILSNTNITLAGTITGSTANTSNVIGGVVLSNNNISNSGTTTTANILASGYVRNALVPTEFDISGGRIRTAVGSVSNPAFGFLATDISAGLYLAASNRLGVAVGGTARLLIDNSSIAVGTPVSATKTALFEIGGGYNPTGTAAARSFPAIAFQYGDATLGGFRHFIRVRHSGAPDNCNAIDFFLNNSSSEGTSVAPGVGNVLAMSVTGTGVGIGMSNPQFLLDISSATASAGVRVTASNAQLNVFDPRSTHSLQLYQNGGNSTQGLFSQNNYRLDFTVGGSVRMCISANGQVGIGTTAPLYALDIAGPTTTDVRIASGGNTNGAGGQLNFGIANGLGATNPMAAIKGLLVNFPTIGGTAQEQGSLGFYTRASNATVSQNLVERMRILHDGNVGIGTSNLSNYRLTIRGTGTTNGGIAFHSATNDIPFTGIVYDETADATIFRTNVGALDFNSNVMSIKRAGSNGGFVGIGTTAPTNFLHIQKGNYNNLGNNVDGTSFGIQFGSSNFTDQAKILAFDKTSGGGAFGGGLAFHTGFNGSSEKVRINPDGRVGIGTSNPQYALDISVGDQVNQGINITAQNAQVNIREVGLPAGSFFQMYQNFSNQGFYTATTNPMYFWVGNVLRASINGSTGHVGIGLGTTAPSYRLDVAADATSNASINMTTWPRTTASICYCGTSSNNRSTEAIIFTQNTAISSNIITVASNAGTYFTINRNGIYAFSIFAGGATNGGFDFLLDASTNIGHSNTANTIILSAFTGWNGAGKNTIHFTGYLPSNSAMYYKVKVSANLLSPFVRIIITFLGETTAQSGYFI